MKVAIIGGGAAGFFSAINVKENYPEAKVIIFEKSNKLLAKVKISGGGRCNVTNGCTSIKELTEAYPRGGKLLKKAFRVFNTQHAMNWFEQRGVPLVIQDDNCVFPRSQSSQTIIDCFLNEVKKLQIKIVIGKGISAIEKVNNQLALRFSNGDKEIVDKVIIATGGAPKLEQLNWLKALNHKIEMPVTSLFTFNMPNESIVKLKGVVVENAIVNIQGTKLKSNGPLLVTHWGMSGPAILKLSAFGARLLFENKYNFKVQVNWIGESNNSIVMDQLNSLIEVNTNKILANARPSKLPERLWLYLLDKCELPAKKKWGELGKKGTNKIINILTNDIYTVSGKTTFKEEFVTCGGISLESINLTTMRSMVCENLYFAGEVMDIDGITGGFNFQAAWTTAFIAGKLN